MAGNVAPRAESQQRNDDLNELRGGFPPKASTP